MKRSLLFLTCLTFALSMTGCESCRRLFGLDRRCDQQQPPPSYYQQPPMYNSAPVNYAPAPCNAPPMK